MTVNKFIQNAHVKKGKLHEQLGYSKTKPIPMGVLERIEKTSVGNKVVVKGKSRRVTPLLKHRVTFAINAQKRRY